jgi:hypothetical protein
MRQGLSLFKHISEFVDQRLEGQFASLDDELKSQHAHVILDIWDASHRLEGQLHETEEALRRRIKTKGASIAEMGRIIYAAQENLLTLTEVSEQCILSRADEDSHPDLAARNPTASLPSTKNCLIMPRITESHRIFARQHHM